ncbi:MAG: hypothetical protein JO297_18825 [Nitrososphaeraceae archaeon]|nr:hypothetical protein [Nitrososphaeraceae archaeon]
MASSIEIYYLKLLILFATPPTPSDVCPSGEDEPSSHEASEHVSELGSPIIIMSRSRESLKKL